jgi:hypothetical protein
VGGAGFEPASPGRAQAVSNIVHYEPQRHSNDKWTVYGSVTVIPLNRPIFGIDHCRKIQGFPWLFWLLEREARFW